MSKVWTLVLDVKKKKRTNRCYIPEEAPIIHDSGAICSGTVADLGGGSVEATKTVPLGEVVPALKHGICYHRSPSFLCCAKVLATIANLCPQLRKRSIDVGIEVAQAGCVVWAARFDYQKCLWVCNNCTMMMMMIPCPPPYQG